MYTAMMQIAMSMSGCVLLIPRDIEICHMIGVWATPEMYALSLKGINHFVCTLNFLSRWLVGRAGVLRKSFITFFQKVITVKIFWEHQRGLVPIPKVL